MKLSATARLFLSLLIFLCSAPVVAQQTPSRQELQRLYEVTSDLEFQLALEKYVRDRFLEYSEFRLPQERYLIQLMRLVNREMARRLKNPKKSRQKYFQELEQMLQEIESLKGRLKASGIRELDSFVEELQKRIERTIRAGEIDFKKKKVFEDALQMLYVAEEMVRLDMSKAPQSENLANRIVQSKEKLLNAFGEVNVSAPAAGKQVTVYDLFEAWRQTQAVKFQTRLNDVRLVRLNLLKTATPNQILGMFRDELEAAINHFNQYNYEVAEQLFDDLIKVYPNWGIKNLDDVYFYRAEAAFALNQLQRAEHFYKEALEAYPASEFLPRIYARLVQVSYALQNYQQAADYGGRYRSIATPDDPLYYDTVFLEALAHRAMDNVNQVVDLLLNLPRGNPYYHLAQYIIGNMYARNQLYADAENVYLSLTEDGSTPPVVVIRSYYKLGILKYEEGNYPEALRYLKQIPENYGHYDKVLNALAWTSFQLAQSSEVEPKDYSDAYWYARRLVDNYPESPFVLEATSLMAYISQLVDFPADAIAMYRDVYGAKIAKKQTDEFLAEKQRIRQLYLQAQDLQEKAFQHNNKKAYLEASNLIDRLDEELFRLEMSESAPVGAGLLQEIAELTRQINELERLRKKAELEKDREAMARIDSLKLRLAVVLDRIPTGLLEKTRFINYFDRYPFSYQISKEKNLYQTLVQRRAEAKQEMSRIDASLADLERELQSARRAGNFALVAKLERQKSDLEALRNKFDAFLAESYQLDVDADPYPEFDKWADIGAFGVINVHFEEKRKAENRLKKIAQLLDKLNEDLGQRKKSIEDKIKKIDAEIRFMTMRVRMEERRRRRAEREREFREQFFDTRPGEVEEQE
ncbi:MAG: hypothetical protein D6715_03955 [Calditrichaeota bacterium]|nr:MAG: hypothetical protein D6715_03955 [Calditrichota bacterium]